MAIINPLPTTLSPGDEIDANVLMTIFNWILSQVNANALPIGSTSLPEFTYERESITALGNLNASQAINWLSQGFVTVTVTGASATFTYTNLPATNGQAILFRVTNGGLATNLFGAAIVPAGFALSVAGVDWVSVACVDGTNVEVIGLTKV